MTVWAIVHSATRVIRGLTTDQPPECPAGFEAVAVSGDTSLMGGPYVLDKQGNRVKATEQQARDAFAGTGFEAEMAALAVANGP